MVDVELTTIAVQVPLKLELDSTKAETAKVAGEPISWDTFLSMMYVVYLSKFCGLSTEEIRKRVPNFEDVKGLIPAEKEKE